MTLTEHPDPPGTLLIIEAKTRNERDTLLNFARLKEPLTAKIEHDYHYYYPYLVIRKEQS